MDDDFAQVPGTVDPLGNVPIPTVQDGGGCKWYQVDCHIESFFDYLAGWGSAVWDSSLGIFVTVANTCQIPEAAAIIQSISIPTELFWMFNLMKVPLLVQILVSATVCLFTIKLLRSLPFVRHIPVIGAG